MAEMQERAGDYEGMVTYASVRAAVQAFQALPEGSDTGSATQEERRSGEADRDRRS